MIKSGEITVSKKTLLHVSEGIYRSAGSAIKELISNAFDANAQNVSITTNYPRFEFLSIQDDGDGMSISEFLRIVEGGIGDSNKASLETNNDRPIIGKLGIGILAIAQICRSFTIISHHKETKTAFKGKMSFNPSVDKVAKESKIDTTGKGYTAGTWKHEENIDYDEKKAGVLIFSDDLRLAFKDRFKKSPQNLGEYPTIFKNYFKKIIEDQFPTNHRTIKELGPYHELIWELANLIPVKYLGYGPIRDEYLDIITYYDNEKKLMNFLIDKQSELRDYNFNVMIDNINLSRFVHLPLPKYRDNRYQECQLYFFEFDKKVRNRRLAFKGYFFAQEFALYPRELKGVQIRIKNVGIGLYDPSFLGFDQIQSPRDNWITGEIYVEEGLESALNIDRDSFNENDEHYYILRREVHKVLKEQVFPDVGKRFRARNKKSREMKAQKSIQKTKKQFNEVVKSYFPKLAYSFEANLNQIKFDRDNNEIKFPITILEGKLHKKREIFMSNIFEIYEDLKRVSNDDSKTKEFIKEISNLILN